MSNTTKLRTELKLQQKLQLNTKLVQSINLMRMSYHELYSHLKNQLEENPFLQGEKKSTWEQYVIHNTHTGENYHSPPNRNSTHDVITQVVAAQPNLFQKLQEQLMFVFSRKTKQYQVALQILSSLDKHGFFSQKKRNELKELQKISEEELLSIIAKIQNLDPAGIASCDVKDYLIFQLCVKEVQEKEDYGWIKTLIKDHFALLGDLKNENRLKHLEKKTNIDSEKLKKGVKIISTLSPYPDKFSHPQAVAHIIPEVVFFVEDGRVFARIPEQLYPVFKLNKKLRKQVVENKTKGDNGFPHDQTKKLESYSKQKISEAENIIAAVEYRKTLLWDVVKAILKRQTDFFIQGSDKLSPFTITELAKELKLNKSTISRLVNSKFAETSFGILPLRYFFNHSYVRFTPANSTTAVTKFRRKGRVHQVGGKMGKAAVIGRIKKIEKELKDYSNKRITDKHVRNMLNKQGIKIARRTVNKYRRECHHKRMSSIETGLKTGG